MSSEAQEDHKKEEKIATFDKTKHVKFLLHMLNVLPTPYASQDLNRLTLLHFVVGSLDLLKMMDKVDKKAVIDWVYAQQVLPDKDDPEKYNNCGFRGGPFFGRPFDPSGDVSKSSYHAHDQAHIAMTFSALCILAVCGDDFSRFNKTAIIKAIKKLQQPNGSFSPVSGGSENDMRFVYCAAVISYMLNDFSGIDIDKAVQYILSSQSYDSGIAQGPGQESHGGSNFCAVAALQLMGRLHDLPRRDELMRWCVERQISGFQGRINKPADACYSLWIGGALYLLGSYHLIEYAQVRAFILSCQPSMGGISKWPNYHPDVMHTYLGLCGMCIGGEPDLEPIDCALVLSKRAVANLPRFREQKL